MTKFKNAMEIYKLLDQSNCKKCFMPGCLAFAGAVFTGKKQLTDCPNLSQDALDQARPKVSPVNPHEKMMLDLMEDLRRDIHNIDLENAAKIIGADFSEGKLTLKILGKNFSIDRNGTPFTEIHVNPYVAIPVYRYILKGAKKEISGRWLPFRELPSGKEGAALLSRRCEQPLKRLADSFTDLFDDMIHLFGGRQIENYHGADISLILFPLPKIPILICYWKQDQEMSSDLNLFFDATAEDNLDIDSLNAMATGLVWMFQKIALRHS